MHSDDVITEKLADAALPGYQVEFSPDEAEAVGAFTENAIELNEAQDSSPDILTKEKKE